MRRRAGVISWCARGKEQHGGEWSLEMPDLFCSVLRSGPRRDRAGQGRSTPEEDYGTVLYLR